MVNRQSPPLIFVYDSKGRTRYCGVAFQTRDETLGEQSLPAAQLTFESQHGTGIHVARKLPPNGFRFSGAVGNERSHGAICDLRLESPAVASHLLRAICDLGRLFESAATLGIFVATLGPNGFCHTAKSQRAIRSPRLLKSRCRWWHRGRGANFPARCQIRLCLRAQVAEDRLRVRRLNPSSHGSRSFL